MLSRRCGNSDHVLSTAHEHHAFFYKRIAEARVEGGRSGILPPSPDDLVVRLAILGERDVDEGGIHVHMRVLFMGLLQTLCCLLEPVDLVLLDPIITLERLLVRRVTMSVEKV